MPETNLAEVEEKLKYYQDRCQKLFTIICLNLKEIKNTDGDDRVKLLTDSFLEKLTEAMYDKYRVSLESLGESYLEDVKSAGAIENKRLKLLLEEREIEIETLKKTTTRRSQKPQTSDRDVRPFYPPITIDLNIMKALKCAELSATPSSTSTSKLAPRAYRSVPSAHTQLNTLPSSDKPTASNEDDQILGLDMSECSTRRSSTTDSGTISACTDKHLKRFPDSLEDDEIINDLPRLKKRRISSNNKPSINHILISDNSEEECHGQSGKSTSDDEV